jgi:hypothetical protein
MPSMTLAISEDFRDQLKSFLWINWSELAREIVLKKEIFEIYIKTKKISDEDWKFCEKINWHPVDELPIKEEFVKELNKRKKGHFIKLNSIAEIFE